nr:hypothetical protein [Tanacetum cinerariifolium]
MDEVSLPFNATAEGENEAQPNNISTDQPANQENLAPTYRELQPVTSLDVHDTLALVERYKLRTLRFRNSWFCFQRFRNIAFLLEGFASHVLDLKLLYSILKDYDLLYDNLSQFKAHVQASKAKKAARNHDPSALVAHLNVYSLHSNASTSYSYSPQPYYVTYSSSDIDYEEGYQGELQGDAQEDKLTTTMMLLPRAITQRHYARNCPKPKVRDAKYFRKQMLMEIKDEAGGNLNDEENDFMLDNVYGDDTLEALSTTVIMMARIQPADDKADAESNYDVEAISEAFKERENKYLDDIVDLEEQLSSHNRIVYEMSLSIQTIHMLRKKPNKVYDPYLKVGLGDQNPECLKKSITAQPKMYDGERLQSTKLIIDSPDSKETLNTRKKVD